MVGSRNRKLDAESLESRYLLHGGGFGGLCVPPTIEEHVEAVFERFDATEDGVLDEADELPDRVMQQLADVDADGDGGVTTEELTQFYQASVVSKLLGVGDTSGHDRHLPRDDAAQRVERAIEVVDDDGGGDIDQSEVSGALWEQLAAADTNDDASLSSDELVTFVESLDADRLAADIAERVDATFERYDADENGAITASEVPERCWNRFADADSDGDESVSKEELTQYLTDQVNDGESVPPSFFVGGPGGHHHHHGWR